MKATANVLKVMDRLLEEYKKDVERAKQMGLVSKKTAKTYTYHPKNFIRWCYDDFLQVKKTRNCI